MHPMFFGIKRVHLRTLAVSRALLQKRVPLTPARFDMIRIVELHTEGIPQRNIQYLLGVSAPTVSRMLKSLERLGMIVRRPWERDRRSLYVRLTERGREVVRVAREALVDSGIAERFSLRGLGSNPQTARPDRDLLQRFLARIRRAYGDYPRFEHPWRVGCVDEDLLPPVILDGWYPYAERAL